MYYTVEFIEDMISNTSHFSVCQTFNTFTEAIKNINNILTKTCMSEMIVGRNDDFQTYPFSVILSWESLPPQDKWSCALCYAKDFNEILQSKFTFNDDNIFITGQENIDSHKLDKLALVHNEDIYNNLEYFFISNVALAEIEDNYELQEIVLKIKTFDEDFYSELNILDTLTGPFYDFLKIILEKDSTFFVKTFKIYLDKFMKQCKLEDMSQSQQKMFKDDLQIYKKSLIKSFMHINIDDDYYLTLLDTLNNYILNKKYECYCVKRKPSYDLTQYKIEDPSDIEDDSSNDSSSNLSSEPSSDYDSEQYKQNEQNKSSDNESSDNDELVNKRKIEEENAMLNNDEDSIEKLFK